MSENRRPILSLRRSRSEDPLPRERLQKVLAYAGLGSRRAIEQRIVRGEVKVNGKVALIGDTVGRGDRVEIDGRFFVVTAEVELPRILVYHKPEGEISTSEDPENRATVFDRLPPVGDGRWIAVGRLDANTTGLMLFTTDGELANRLMHPSHGVEREYVCRIRGAADRPALERLLSGVELEDGRARFEHVQRIDAGGGSHAWYRVVIREGRNREVRRLWESQGLTVSRLKRVRYGPITLPRSLRRGHWVELSPEAVGEVLAALSRDERQAPLLALRPVLHQRGIRGKLIEAPGADAWVGERLAEAQEFAAFDRLAAPTPAGRGAPPRSRSPGKRRPSFKKPKKADGSRGALGPRGKTERRRSRVAPGQPIPDDFRSWYVPEGGATSPFAEGTPPRRGLPRKPRRRPGPGLRRRPDRAPPPEDHGGGED